MKFLLTFSINNCIIAVLKQKINLNGRQMTSRHSHQLWQQDILGGMHALSLCSFIGYSDRPEPKTPSVSTETI